MSDLLTAYSNYCGVTPEGSPDFPSIFIPLPEDKYITICSGALRPADVYDYYNKALGLVSLTHKIVQIGAQTDYPIFGALDYRGKANLRQEAFVIENGALHIGNDHVFNHIAAAKNIPLVGLYSSMPVSCAAPATIARSISLEPVRAGKPSYAHEENPKTINKILPETVAAAIADLLGVDYQKIKTVRIGQHYNFEQIDVVPDFAIQLNIFQGRRMVCRYDLCPNKDGLIHFLQAYGGPILTEDPIDPQILTPLKPRIPQILYFLDKNYSKDFINFLHYSGIPYELVTSKEGKALADLKLELFDFNQIKSRQIVDLNGVTPEMYFETKRAFFSRGKFYPTAWHLSEGVDVDSCDYKMTGMHSKKFQDSWDNLYIFEK